MILTYVMVFVRNSIHKIQTTVLLSIDFARFSLLNSHLSLLNDNFFASYLPKNTNYLLFIAIMT